jgi:hypothetical protein
MDPWGCSNFTNKIMLRLIEFGLLRSVMNIV